MTATGAYPPATATTTARYVIASINAMAANIDCLNGLHPAEQQGGPYGPFCSMDAIRPLHSHTTSSAARKKSRRKAPRHAKRAKHGAAGR